MMDFSYNLSLISIDPAIKLLFFDEPEHWRPSLAKEKLEGKMEDRFYINFDESFSYTS